ncbi:MULTISPECIES: hypothetical protein [Bacillaceae]|nr:MULTISPECIES: hypothetical protein [Bacillaceae]
MNVTQRKTDCQIKKDSALQGGQEKYHQKIRNKGKCSYATG